METARSCDLLSNLVKNCFVDYGKERRFLGSREYFNEKRKRETATKLKELFDDLGRSPPARTNRAAFSRKVSMTDRRQSPKR